MSDVANKAVFLSYASQDADAAKRICEALRAAGVEVWFDQSELRGGDAWDAKIRKQIKECALFLPLITPTTNARAEGYFRLEWKLAVDRSHLLADDHPFLFPIVVGDVVDATARVPDKFRDVQWTRLRLDETPAELGARVAKLLAGDATADFIASVSPGRRTRAGRWSWWMVFPIIGTIMGLMFAALPLWKAIKGPSPKRFAPPVATAPAAPTLATRVEDKSVAVLAFANLSDDKASEYFSDGISEELLNVLAKVPGLKVSARTSAFYFKGKEVPVSEIAKQLGVAYLVEGTVRNAGGKVRITAQLIKAADGFQVWNDTFTRDLKDIFAVQDEIAGLVAKNISPVLTHATPAASRQANPEAFQAYLAGRALAAKAGIANLREAVALFGQAVQLDPAYTAARVQQARAYVQLGRWGGLVPKEAWAAARAALAPALAAEPDSPDVLVAQGWILRTADWKWREAEQAFNRAMELRPNDTDVLASAAVLQLGMGKADEAHGLVRRTIELDPLNPATQFDLGMVYRFSGRLPEAERQFRRALELSPQGQRYRTFLSLVLTGLGRLDEAEALARAEPDELSRDFALGLVAAARHDPATVRAILQRFEKNRATMERLADFNVYAAALRGAVGELDAGLAELDRALAARDSSIGWLKVNYLLQPLHAHPRWPEVLRAAGLADDQLK